MKLEPFFACTKCGALFFCNFEHCAGGPHDCAACFDKIREDAIRRLKEPAVHGRPWCHAHDCPALQCGC